MAGFFYGKIMATIPTQNPVPSEAAADLKFNAGKIDEFVTSFLLKYTDRLGREHLTIEGIRDIVERAIKEFGWTTIDSFEIGATINNSSEVLRWESNGEYYRWDGSFPKTVPAGSTPTATGGIGIGAWVGIGDAALRSALVSAAGASMIGTQTSGTVQSKLDEIDNSIAALELSYQLRNSRYLGIANKKIKAGEAITIVCVGDSMTAGYDATSTDRIPATNGDWATHAPVQYPMQVETRLNFFTSSATTVINRGYSGETAKSCFTRWTTNPNSHVAHIMLGINDSRGSNGSTFEEYCKYMELIIRRYIDWGCGVVLHTATAVTFNNANDPSGYFTEFVRSIAKSYNCPVFESEGVHQYRIGTSFQSDGTHFNKIGYALYGDAVTAFILSGGWVGHNRLINSLTSIQSG